jgi:hypothetical protein
VLVWIPYEALDVVGNDLAADVLWAMISQPTCCENRASCNDALRRVKHRWHIIIADLPGRELYISYYMVCATR